MKNTRMKLLLGVTLPALMLGGCGAMDQAANKVSSLHASLLGTESATKVEDSESLLAAEHGLWNLYEQEDEIDPVALHAQARASVNPADKSRKRFLPEERLVMAEGAPSGNDQNHRVIRVARIEMDGAPKGTENLIPARKEIVLAEAEPIVRKKKPSFVVTSHNNDDENARTAGTMTAGVEEVVLGGGSRGEKPAVVPKGAPVKQSPVEFVTSAAMPKPHNKPLRSVEVASAEAEVNQMRLGEHPDKTRLVLDLSGEAKYKTEIDASGKFLTVELAHAGWRTKTQSLVQSALISGYTAEPSANGQGTRLRLELKKPAKIVGAAALPPNAGRPYRIYFDITAV